MSEEGSDNENEVSGEEEESPQSDAAEESASGGGKPSLNFRLFFFGLVYCSQIEVYPLSIPIKISLPSDFATLDCVLVIAFFDNVQYCVVEWHVFEHVFMLFHRGR